MSQAGQRGSGKCSRGGLGIRPPVGPVGGAPKTPAGTPPPKPPCAPPGQAAPATSALATSALARTWPNLGKCFAARPAASAAPCARRTRLAGASSSLLAPPSVSTPRLRFSALKASSVRFKLALVAANSASISAMGSGDLWTAASWALVQNVSHAASAKLPPQSGSFCTLVTNDLDRITASRLATSDSRWAGDHGTDCSRRPSPKCSVLDGPGSLDASSTDGRSRIFRARRAACASEASAPACRMSATNMTTLALAIL